MKHSWAGWRIGSFGHVRDWRILTPEGDHLQAADLASHCARMLDLAYLKMAAAMPAETMQAEKLVGSTMAFSRDESQLLRVALDLMLRELPVQWAGESTRCGRRCRYGRLRR